MPILHERARNGVNKHGTWGNAGASVLLSFAMARPRRSTSSHIARVKALPHVARLHRVEPLRQTDEAALLAAVKRIARPAGWYAVAGWAPEDVDFRLYRFATAAEAMQRWIAESRIESRPAPAPCQGLQLAVAGGTMHFWSVPGPIGP